MTKGILFFILFGASSSFASDLLMTQSNGTGHTPPQSSLHEKCEIFNDHVMITRSVGYPAIEVHEQRALNLSGQVSELINLAATEKVIEVKTDICDGATTQVIAMTKENPEIVLYQTGSCGRPMQQRVGTATRVLNNIITANCSLKMY